MVDDADGGADEVVGDVDGGADDKVGDGDGGADDVVDDGDELMIFVFISNSIAFSINRSK